MSIVTCNHCGSTGRLTGSAYLDCAHCDVAGKRLNLEGWAIKHGIGYIDPEHLYAIYLHAQHAERTEAT